MTRIFYFFQRGLFINLNSETVHGIPQLNSQKPSLNVFRQSAYLKEVNKFKLKATNNVFQIIKETLRVLFFIMLQTFFTFIV